MSSVISDAQPAVSVIINNYNYARFLNAAIDSALNQRYPLIEIIVVDDGSTDDSREIILSYGDRITAIFKENGGQASALNAAVAASRGNILCFLDADDFYHPDKVVRVVDTFRQHGTNSKALLVHHLLRLTKEGSTELYSRPFGRTHDSPLNLYAFAQRYRFVWHAAGPTTAISINRILADRLFPLPEKGLPAHADTFVVRGASLIGELYSMKDILGGYRAHDSNYWFPGNTRPAPELVCALQDYLNSKLVENGQLPVISFDDSIFALSGLVADRRWLELWALVIRLSIRNHDRYTARFIWRALMGKSDI